MIWRKLHYIFNRRRLDRELEAELDAHRAEMGGRSSDFGSTLKLREESNDAWGFGWFDRLWQDVHYGSRMLRKSPGFTLTAVGILALGIGLNITAFGFFNTLILRPLRVKDPDTMTRLLRQAPGSMSDNFSYPAFDFYRRHNRVFSSMWAISSGELLLESGSPANARFVTPEFWPEMGGEPALSHFFDAADQPGGVVLGYDFWQSKFGGDPGVLGKKIRLNQYTAVISGVLPKNYISVEPETLDVWLPMSDYPLYVPGTKLLTDTEAVSVRMYGRLLPGLSRAAAEAGLRPIVDEYRLQAPQDVWKDEYLPVQRGAYIAAPRPSEMALMIVPAFLLLLVLAAACANLGNLLLARGAIRAREISIRSAAGASRRRIIRQLLTESVMLALLGAAAGIPISVAAIRLFIYASGAPDNLDFAPDWRIALFALGIALVAAILFGLPPALRTSRPEARRTTRTRLVLVAAQVAVSCILVILSGLMTRGVQRALVSSPGFSFEQSANIRLDLGTAGVRGHAARLFLDQFRAQISQVPGVEAVALSTLPPLGNAMSSMYSDVGAITLHSVDAAYFRTMEIPLLQGRLFNQIDSGTNIIIGQRLAEKLWPNENPIGKEFPSNGKVRGTIVLPRAPMWTVIGVAANAPTVGFGDSDTMELYQPLTDGGMESATVVVRTQTLTPVLPTLVKVASAAAGKLTARVRPMREGFDQRMRMGRVAAMSISALGAVALLVALVGLAGLISYSVTQKTKEIGIRMALGARPVEALRVGLAELVKPVAIGMIIGAGSAAGLAQAMRAMLYGISTVDPLAYASALALFVALAAMSAAAPLRRATQVDPATALRHD